jgi:chromosome segregation ATPase
MFQKAMTPPHRASGPERHPTPDREALRRENERLRRQVEQLRQQLSEQAEQLVRKERQIVDAGKRINDVEKQILEAEKQISDLERQLALFRWSSRRSARTRTKKEEPAESRRSTWPPRSASSTRTGRKSR